MVRSKKQKLRAAKHPPALGPGVQAIVYFNQTGQSDGSRFPLPVPVLAEASGEGKFVFEESIFAVSFSGKNSFSYAL
jgi:hypothetical protein